MRSGVDERLRAAIFDNAHWCDAVVTANAIPTLWSDSLWCAARRSPLFYPDAVTLAPGIAAAEVARKVTPGPGASVKDSFADLALDEHGYRILFDAQWYYRPSGTSPPGDSDAWSVVRSGKLLDRWAEGHGSAAAVVPAIRACEQVTALARQDASGAVIGGAIVTRSDQAAGISNVFAVGDPDDGLWPDLVAAVSRRFPGLPIVGYSREPELPAVLAVGFVAVGPLRVWAMPGT